MINFRVKTVLQSYKSNFYQKSLQLRTDFSLYNRYFKDWHARYFDVIRRTKYQHEKRDYRKLRFNTQDPMFFDQKNEHINGGIKRLIENIEKEPELVIDPYRCVYLMYNMARYNHMNKEFFTKVDGLLNTKAIDSETLILRYPFAALYAYYKFNLGRAENISFFEREMPDFISEFHYFELLELLEVMCDSTLYPREHFEHQYNVYLKPSLIENFEREFANRQQVLYQLAVLLRKFGSMDPTLWDLWVKRVVKIKRVQNIEDFDKFLHMLIWVNEYPKSPKFGLIKNEIEIFKDQIKKNPNRFWKYDPDKGAFRSYQELMETREDIDESYEIGSPIHDEKEEEEEIKLDEKDQVTLIKETFNKLIEEKKNVREIISTICSHGYNPILVDDIVTSYIEDRQKEISSKLSAEGKIGVKEKKQKRKKKAAAAPGGKGGAAAGKKK